MRKSSQSNFFSVYLWHGLLWEIFLYQLQTLFYNHYKKEFYSLKFILRFFCENTLWISLKIKYLMLTEWVKLLLVHCNRRCIKIALVWSNNNYFYDKSHHRPWKFNDVIEWNSLFKHRAEILTVCWFFNSNFCHNSVYDHVHSEWSSNPYSGDSGCSTKAKLEIFSPQ